MSESSTKQRLIVVGGGVGGLEFINGLKSARSQFDITLIDSKNFVEAPPFVISQLVIPEKAKEVHMLYTDMANLQDVHFVHGVVAKINSAENTIELRDGKTLGYDKLVLSVGSRYAIHPWLPKSKVLQYELASSSASSASASSSNAATDDAWSLISSTLSIRFPRRLQSEILSSAAGKPLVFLLAGLAALSKGAVDVNINSLTQSLASKDVEDIIGAVLRKSLRQALKAYQSAEDKTSARSKLGKLAKKLVLEAEPFLQSFLSAGSPLPFAGATSTLERRQLELKTQAQRFADARSIAVIGAGVVGIELAAELAAVYPSKHITIIHSGAKFLEFTNSGRAQQHVANFFATKGVHTVFNQIVERVVDYDSYSVVTTKSGIDIKADVVLSTVGTQPNTSFLRSDGTLAAALTPGGFVKVDPYFKVEGTDSIYCIGDACNGTEPKTAVTTGEHGKFLAKTFNEQAQNYTISKWVGWTDYPMLSVSLGPWDGLLIIKGWCISKGGLGFTLKKMFGRKISLARGMSPDNFNEDWDKFTLKLRESVDQGTQK